MESCVSLRRKAVKSGRIMNEENDWDHNVEGDAVKGPVVCLSREEVLHALNETKTEKKAPGPSEESLELIAASIGVGVQVMTEICQKVLDEFGMDLNELCEKVVEVRRASDRAMSLVVVFEKDVLRLICGKAPQSGRCFE